MLPATSTPAVNNRSGRIFSKILVAIDGSDPSMNAAEHAISVSEAFSAELYTLHVIHVDVDLFGPADTPHDVIQMNKQAHEYLNRVKLKGNKKYKIKTEIIISVNVPRGIVEYAENKNIDLIVVGTRGRSGFRKLLLSSVASSVIEYSHCPVLVIRQLRSKYKETRLSLFGLRSIPYVLPSLQEENTVTTNLIAFTIRFS